jgi:hypothetical protein
MAHNKVYGICENKCRVEVIPKCENKIMGGNPINIGTAQNGIRYISRHGDVRIINVYVPSDFDGYFEVVVVRADRSTVKPSSYLKITGSYVKFINDDNLDLTHDVLCYKFYNNGIGNVCECMSYAS